MTSIRIMLPFFFLAAWSLLVPYAQAQPTTGTLQGHVTDPSGAVIPGAVVSATPAGGKHVTAQSNQNGEYEINGLQPGSYTVRARAKGFSYHQDNVSVTSGKVQLDIALSIEVKQENVTVQDEATTLDVAPENNANSIVIKGKDLEALSDDPDELQSELEALAGPSAGPNGGQIYIDGFTGGQLPPKSSIREIRINQNPFSAEFDKLGYGRIEIFTKPGTNQYHGQFFFTDNDSIFNTRNPFLPQEPPAYQTEYYNGSVSGPVGKKVSFFFNAERRNINDFSVVNAVVLSPGFTQQSFSQAVSNPSSRTNISPRFDFQLGQNNTLTVRYQFVRLNQTNNGVGQFALPSQAFDVNNTEQTLQISDTQVLSSNMINETRFQYVRDRNNQASAGSQPTVSVIGAFTGGSNPLQGVTDHQDHYELQNFTSIVHGKHMMKFGGRLRVARDSNDATTNFNGTFTFPSLAAYQTTELGLAQGLSPAQIRAAGGGASQFAIITGQSSAAVSLVDVGLYAEDEWRLRPNMTLSYGLRLESQSGIRDHADLAPRVSYSWGLGNGKNPPKTVLRAGWGIFYDRFTYDFLLQAQRLNGLTQSQATITSPDFFPNIPSGQLPGAVSSPTEYRIAPDLLAPASMQTAVSIERQLTKKATVAVTYLNSRGTHQLFLRNINAPLPGSVSATNPNGSRPLGGTTNIYEYDSAGIFRQNQLIANARFNLGSSISLFGYYTLNYANSDLGSPGGTFSVSGSSGGSGFSSGGATGSANFLSDSGDPMADYGRAAFDVHHRILVAGTVSLPDQFRINPFILFTSGRPFDITVGQDLNGDSIFNDRPAFADSSTTANARQTTALGVFNNSPSPTQPRIPIYYGTGPSLVTVNMRLSKTFGVGPKLSQEKATATGGAQGQGGRGGGGRGGGGLGGRGLSGGGGPGGLSAAAPTNRRYSLTFSVAARNLLNRSNLASPVGNLSSPLFGRSNALAGPPFSSGAANRRFDVQAMFTF